MNRELYLDLLKKCLVGLIWDDPGVGLSVKVRLPLSLGRRSLRSLFSFLSMRSLGSFDRQARMEGRDWPKSAHTMIGLARLENLQYCIEDVIRNSVPGDLIEAGAWRGGASIFMRGVLKAYGVSERVVWVADSFAGLPAPDPNKYPADKGSVFHDIDLLKVSLEEVQANFSKYGLLDENVRFLRGWFSETLPGAPINRLAVLRIDADMYQSTMDVLTSMYPKLSVGGYVIIDDYGCVPACKAAVDYFRTENAIRDAIRKIDWTGVFWKRSV